MGKCVGKCVTPNTALCCDVCDESEECFPGDAKVELENGKKTFMSDLKVGDHVRVGPSEFSEVYMFTHNNAEVKVSKQTW